MGMRPPSRYDLYGICPGQVSYKCLPYGSWSTVLGIPGAVFLSAWADSQCVTNCAGQITALGPLDRSLVSARRMEFAGMPRRAMRTRCGCCRYPFTLLGIVPAVNPVPFLSAWADSRCITNCPGQISVYRDAPMGNASLFGRQLTNTPGLSRFDGSGVQITVYRTVAVRSKPSPGEKVAERQRGRKRNGEI